MAELVDSYYEVGVQRAPPAPPLRGQTTADVCVVGGGLTGISCALELAQAGKSVVVVESERIGWGASGRNGGQFIHGYAAEDLQKPAAQTGADEKYLFDMSLAAINLLRARIEKYKIDCDLRQGYLSAALHARHCRELERAADKMINRYGYPVQILDAAETRAAISSRRYCGALADDNSGHLHPLKYVLGLARAAADSGVVFYENTAATRVEETGAGVAIKTTEGEVRCKETVLAGNAYLSVEPKLRARIMPVGTYVGATAPLGAEAAGNLIAAGRAVCDMNFVLDYFRCGADHRLLFGGRVSYSNNQYPKNLPKVLRRRMSAVFPQIADVPLEYVWGGSLAITLNRFPDIGRRGRAVYYAQGFSGHGLALSGFAGKVLADAITGDAEKLDVFGRVRHANFIGGAGLRAPLLVLGMLYYRLRDLLG
ncbi:MAG: FAD-binding oxidoreductase [Betaproteobacteria bacterium]|nr:FAD-binding oxidoreductase [Betaproteobacteria bacterium]